MIQHARSILEVVRQMMAGTGNTLHRDKLSEDIAKLFCELTDDGQAQFFCHVAQIMSTWRYPQRQVCDIGQHLRDCECSTEAGRQWVEDLRAFMQPEEAEVI